MIFFVKIYSPASLNLWKVKISYPSLAHGRSSTILELNGS